MIDFENIINTNKINQKDIDNLDKLTQEEIIKIIEDYDFDDHELDKLQKILQTFESQYSEDSDFYHDYGSYLEDSDSYSDFRFTIRFRYRR